MNETEYKKYIKLCSLVVLIYALIHLPNLITSIISLIYQAIYLLPYEFADSETNKTLNAAYKNIALQSSRGLIKFILLLIISKWLSKEPKIIKKWIKIENS